MDVGVASDYTPVNLRCKSQSLRLQVIRHESTVVSGLDEKKDGIQVEGIRRTWMLGLQVIIHQSTFDVRVNR